MEQLKVNNLDQHRHRLRNSDPPRHGGLQSINHSQSEISEPQVAAENTEQYIEITRCDNSTLQDEDTIKKKGTIRKSCGKSSRTRPSNNRHMRSAITFILITASFLISYLPSLLIANGFIWPVNWELSPDSTNGLVHPQNMHVTNYSGSILTNKNVTDVLKLPVISNIDELVSKPSSMQPIQQQYQHNISKKEIKYHLRRLFHFLYFINSTANPLIYFFFNLKFRTELKRLVNCMKSCFSN
ncbi:unnamed protein product [Heterobilharzia americana]|nr:unnamed protein product [Heterobilharzia americana]